MTIHAGEKAARLRRAAASSTLAATVNSSTSSTTFSPLHGTKDTIEAPLLSASPIADADVLGVQPCPIEPVQSSNVSILHSRRSTGNCKKSHHQHHHNQQHNHHPKQACHRHGNGQKQLHSASCTSLQAISGHFVFSGMDLPSSQSIEPTPVNWDTFDIHNPASTLENSQTLIQPALVFVPQPFEKGYCDASTSLQEDTSITSSETPPTSRTKSSPRRFLSSWFLTLSPSSSSIASPPVAEPDETTTSNNDVQANDSIGEDTKKSSKKKRKKRKKGKGKARDHKSGEDEMEGTDQVDDEIEASEENIKVPFSQSILESSNHAKVELRIDEGAGSFSSEGESQEETVKHGDQSLLSSDLEEINEAFQCDRANTTNSQEVPSSSASFCPCPSSQQFQLAKSKKNRKAMQRRESQARETERIKIENEKKDKASQPLHVKEAESQKLGRSHCHNISRTETEISYHTATALPDEAFGTQSLDSQDVLSSEKIQDRHKEESKGHNTVESCLSPYQPLDDKLGTSAVSSVTEQESLSTSRKRGSSHNSPTLGLRTVEQLKELVTIKPSGWSQCAAPESHISSLTGSSSINADFPPLCCTSQPHPDANMDLTSIAEVKRTMETKEEITERQQRTLNWRLRSVGSSSPTSNPPSQDDLLKIHSPPPPPPSPPTPPLQLSVHIPVPSTSLSRRASQQSDVSVPSPSRLQLALQLRRHQQRRLNHAWVHLLPSFEEIYPRHSQKRELQLRRLAWLGLEEYVARKVKASTRDGIGDTVVWITHSYLGRSATSYRTKAFHFEPSMCSSSFWLRSPKNSADNCTKLDVSKAEDAIHHYRSQLLQQKLQTMASAHVNNPLFPTEKFQDGHQLEWPSSPPSEITLRYPILTPTQTSDSIHSSNANKVVDRDSSDIEREDCLELQKAIEACMYELRCANTSIGADVAWLETLKSIGQEEKNAIEAFFHDYTPDWLNTLEDNSPVAEIGCLPPGEVWPYATEMVWPTTPYTPLGLTLGSTNEQSKEEGPTSNDIGLSSCEMQEIEDAMYRDYLTQTNHTYHRSKKKERNHGHGRGAGIGGGGGGGLGHGMRSRASTAFSKSATLVDAQGSLRFPTLPMRARSQDVPPSNPLRFPLQSAEVDESINSSTSSRIDVPPLTSMQEKLSSKLIEGEGDRDLLRTDEMAGQARIQEHPKQDTLGRKQVNQESNSIEATKRQEGQSMDESWAKNRVVRHSLASLQQHLCLVAAQKQNQSMPPKDELASSPTGYASNMAAGRGVVRHQQQSLAQPPNFHQQTIRDIRSWPLSGDSKSIMSVSALQSQRSLRAELKKQQITQEARQLEQRHLDSHAQAMARCSSHSFLTNASFHERQSQDVARLQAALFSEWARYGVGDHKYLDGRHVELTSQFANPMLNPPAITLTKPAAPVKKPAQIKCPDGRIHQRTAWSDEPILSLEEALLQQAQNPWQANILQTGNTQPFQQSCLNQPLEIEPQFGGEFCLRRGSIQSAPSHFSEYGLNMNQQIGDSTSSTSSLRPEVFTPTKVRKNQSHSVGSKRRGKQREGSSQSTLESTIPPHTLPRLPLAPINGEQQHRIVEQHQQQQQNATVIANQAIVHPVLHSYDENLIRRNPSTNSPRQNGGGNHYRKQRRW